MRAAEDAKRLLDEGHPNKDGVGGLRTQCVGAFQYSQRLKLVARGYERAVEDESGCVEPLPSLRHQRLCPKNIKEERTRLQRRMCVGAGWTAMANTSLDSSAHAFKAALSSYTTATTCVLALRWGAYTLSITRSTIVMRRAQALKVEMLLDRRPVKRWARPGMIGRASSIQKLNSSLSKMEGNGASCQCKYSEL